MFNYCSKCQIIFNEVYYKIQINRVIILKGSVPFFCSLTKAIDKVNDFILTSLTLANFIILLTHRVFLHNNSLKFFFTKKKK